MEYLKKQPFASGNRIIVKFCIKVKPIRIKDHSSRQISNYIESNRYLIEQNKQNKLVIV